MKHTEKQANEFIALIRQYERLIHKVCNLFVVHNTEDYKDLYQEIILQAWTAFPKFQHAAKISTWLYRVALNTAINHNRHARKSIKALPFDELFMEVADMQNDSNEEYLLLWRLIRELPEMERALILLYLENNSYEEIAAIMGLTVTNTGTRLGRIREKLKRQAESVTAGQTHCDEMN